MAEHQFRIWLDHQRFPCQSTTDADIFAQELSKAHYTEWAFQNFVFNHQSATAVQTGVSASEKVKKLALRNCEIEESLLEFILDAVTNHISLHELEFVSCDLSEDSLKMVAECISKSPNINTIRFKNIKFTQDARDAINSAVTSASDFIYVDFGQETHEPRGPVSAHQAANGNPNVSNLSSNTSFGSGASSTDFSEESQSGRTMQPDFSDASGPFGSSASVAAASGGNGGGRRRGYTFKVFQNDAGQTVTLGNVAPYVRKEYKTLGKISYGQFEADILEDSRIRDYSNRYFSGPLEWVKTVEQEHPELVPESQRTEPSAQPSVGNNRMGDDEDGDDDEEDLNEHMPPSSA